jgi:SpoVK/Ycf46/Vps4 family AAA+-type ATPase
MKSTSDWLEDNSEYLSAALAWLRLLLQSREQPEGVVSAAVKREGKSSRSTLIDVRIQETFSRVEQLAAEMKPPPALLLLGEALGLSRFERDVLLLCAAPEFDPSIRQLYLEATRRVLSDGDSSESPTFALALSLFESPSWDALSPERPLRYWHLVEIHQPGAQPLASSALQADERIVDFLKGLNRLDDRLSPYLRPLSPSETLAALPASQQAIAERILACWRDADPGLLPLMQLEGPNYDSKQMVAGAIAASLSRRLYRLPADSLPAQAAEVQLLARIWQRESALLPLALFLDAQNIESTEVQMGAARRFLAQASGHLFLAARESWSGLALESRSWLVMKPTREEQTSAWRMALGVEGNELAPQLSSQFNLNLPDIRRIAEESAAGKKASKEQTEERLWDNCLLRARPALNSLAHRIDARATWDDIVLPEQEQRLLHQIAEQVRERSRVYEEWGFGARMNRGLGITALFTGDSGVGKTMAAEVIANDLRLDLYRIDLSSVVSKYIGETEKNLCKLFDAAEDGGAILFFDEADALFGKRSEVKDSHDRYANIEVNYLLQRMESFGGLAVLASNMRGALDAAFTRRLRFILNFPFPNVMDRERMWQRAFPAKTPLHALDYARLAKFNLTGGSISNAAVNAAFLAASKKTPVTMGHALAAIRQELFKLDRPIRESDFAWQDEEETLAEPTQEVA